MAIISARPRIETRITIDLSEAEAGALDALAGYGTDEFLECFYKHMGKAYLQPYEAGLRSLFDSVRHGTAGVALFLQRSRDAQSVFTGQKVAAYVSPKHSGERPIEPAIAKESTESPTKT